MQHGAALLPLEPSIGAASSARLSSVALTNKRAQRPKASERRVPVDDTRVSQCSVPSGAEAQGRAFHPRKFPPCRCCRPAPVSTTLTAPASLGEADSPPASACALARRLRCEGWRGRASTGPRHECRGERREGSLAIAIVARSTLQCGPRHECRGESRAAVDFSADVRTLQCGHGTQAVERRDLPSWKAAVVDPLRRFPMRPRHECRGELDSTHRCAPRCAVTRLQCGHGTNAVDRNPAGSVDTVDRNPRLLQWGHGTNAVDRTRRQSRRPRRPQRFNAATARMPWRTQTVWTRPKTHSRQGRASMRPRQGCRGELVSWIHQKGATGNASMGPRHGCRG